MTRVGDRIRASWQHVLQRELDGVRTELAESWTTSFEDLRRDILTDRAAVATRIDHQHGELLDALHRVAGAFEAIAQSLDADRRDRRAQLDAVEFLLREMVLGLAHPTETTSNVVGGSIDPAALDAAPRGPVSIDLSAPPIALGTHVEVRSRFHDRWVHGFAIAERVVDPDRSGYRLRRLYESDALPLLFDAADVRPVVLAPEPTATIHTVEVEEPEKQHSIWR